MTESEAKFLQAFESCALPAEQWTHHAHVRMAWLCLGEADFIQALERMRAGIRRYNAEVLDKLAEYHETVTVAFAQLIAARRRSGESWQAFAERNQDLFARTPPVLATYYSRERLMSDEARRRFIEPDLRPLPGARDFPDKTTATGGCHEY